MFLAIVATGFRTPRARRDLWKTASVVLGLAVLLSSDFATAQPQPGTPNPTLQQQPGKPHRVVDLKSGSFVIDAPGDWVLNRSWSLEYRGDMPLNVIDVVADNVVLDFRGFTVQVSNTRDIARVTLINVQGRAWTLKNAVVRIGDGAQMLRTTQHRRRNDDRKHDRLQF